jgi:hypothetical protein
MRSLAIFAQDLIGYIKTLWRHDISNRPLLATSSHIVTKVSNSSLLRSVTSFLVDITREQQSCCHDVPWNFLYVLGSGRFLCDMKLLFYMSLVLEDFFVIWSYYFICPWLWKISLWYEVVILYVLGSGRFVCDMKLLFYMSLVVEDLFVIWSCYFICPWYWKISLWYEVVILYVLGCGRFVCDMKLLFYMSLVLEDLFVIWSCYFICPWYWKICLWYEVVILYVPGTGRLLCNMKFYVISCVLSIGRLHSCGISHRVVW